MQTQNTFNLTESLISSESLARLWSGRSRTARAVSTILKIEASYRRLNTELRKGQFSKELKREKLKALHAINAKRLYQLCKHNGATWTKFGQFLSARPDLMPREYIFALEPLQNDTPAVDFQELIPVLESELGPGWRKKFDYIEEKPVATASIGQVHKAKLLDGREVALKIQLPQVRQLFRQDVVLFRALVKILKGRIPHVDITPIINHLLESVAKELDFTIEASNIEEIRCHKHLEGVFFPELVPEFSKLRVICTHWIEGQRLIPFIESQDEPNKKAILSLIQNSFVQQMTQFGLFQNDPHPGNFLIGPNKELYILDFGTVGRLSEEQKRHLIMLFFSLLQGNKDGNLAQLLENAGLIGISQQTLKEVDALVIKYKRMQRMPSMDTVLEELLETLRENQIVIPDYLISVARTVSTLSGLMTRYKIRFDFLPQIPS